MHRDIRYEAIAWRDGAARPVNVATIVPGDVVALGAGDVVPADLRLIAAEGLECDESVLTGSASAAEGSR